MHALAAHAADQLQLEQDRQQVSEVTLAAKRPLRTAAPKPGAHEGLDGEPANDGESEDEYSSNEVSIRKCPHSQANHDNDQSKPCGTRVRVGIGTVG